MINKFIEVVPKKLFRGAAPSPSDVLDLKEKFNIKKIVSLDKESAKKIHRSCQMLGINHVVIPIEMDNFYESLLFLLQKDIKKLLIDGGPTFVHCAAGKDRTGFIIALFKCQYLGANPLDAIEEAKSLGFGVGVNPKYIRTLENLIKKCKPVSDKSLIDFDTNTNIVSNQREYRGDNRDSFLDESRQGSFAPYLSPTKQYPVDAVYNYINDQSPTRQNYQSHSNFNAEQEDVVPLVGLFNNDAGARGVGPVENYSGFFYD